MYILLRRHEFRVDLRVKLFRLTIIKIPRPFLHDDCMISELVSLDEFREMHELAVYAVRLNYLTVIIIRSWVGIQVPRVKEYLTEETSCLGPRLARPSS